MKLRFFLGAAFFMIFVISLAKCSKSSSPGPTLPTLTSISPTAGSTAGGTAITVTGSNFETGATVTVGGVAATQVDVVSATQITAVTPSNSSGTVNLVVTNPDGGSVTLTGAFLYSSGSFPAPTVVSISPNSGSTSGGTSVVITGTNFQTGAGATIGGACTSVTVNSASQIQCTTPANAAGTVDVVVTNPDTQTGTLSGGFTYATVTNFTVVNNGMTAYIINGSSNPPLTLTRGNIYTFTVNASGHPFMIKTVQGAGSSNGYNTGVTNNGIDSGTVTFAVPMSAPSTLYYDCEIHPAMTGTITIQ
jgi:hypothetical protein